MLGRRISTAKLFIVCATITICVGIVTFMNCEQEKITNEIQNNPRDWNPKFNHVQENARINISNKDDGLGSHTLAIIVPYRDRFEEILEFAPWIHRFLNQQNVRHHIVVVNQVDQHRFNRATLINIGYLMTENKVDYIAMHDVDLLPNNPELKYNYPEKGPLHLASPELHPMYHYPKYVGGILMLTTKHFKQCRGLSNKFWGWGREDDEFYLRMTEQQLTLFRPTGITTGYKTFKHIHDKEKRPRDYKRYGKQKKEQFHRDRETGYDTVQYTLQSKKEMTIDGAPLTIYNVELYCDVKITPWCDHE